MIRYLAPLGVFIAIVVWTPAQGGADVFKPREFDSPEQLERYKTLTNGFRCLQCQNQPVSESNAPLASDVRQQVYEMLRSGASDDEIIGFMVSRYGDFVLSQPPFDARTLLLWFGPFILGLAGLGYLWYQIRERRRAGMRVAALSEDERARLARVLDPGRNQEVT